MKNLLKELKQTSLFYNRYLFKLINLYFFKTRSLFLSRLSPFFYLITHFLHF